MCLEDTSLVYHTNTGPVPILETVSIQVHFLAKLPNQQLDNCTVDIMSLLVVVCMLLNVHAVQLTPKHNYKLKRNFDIYT